MLFALSEDLTLVLGPSFVLFLWAFPFFIFSVQSSHSVMSNSLWPMNCSTPGLPDHHSVRSLFLLPSIPPSIRVFSNESTLPWGGQSIGVSASALFLPINTQDWSPLGWTGWTSLQSKVLSRVFSNATVQKHQFFGAQLSSQSNSYIRTWPLEKNIGLTRRTFVGKVKSLLFNMLSWS